MAWRLINHYFRLCAIACISISALAASDQQGQVTFNGLPVPGATVTATRDGRKSVAVTDTQGVYSFPDLTEGAWKMEVTMFGFTKTERDVAIAPNTAAVNWELKLLSLDQIKAEVQQIPAPVQTGAAQSKKELPQPQNRQASAIEGAEDHLSQSFADGLVINGSVNNGAASSFAQAAAFGNARSTGRSLYNGGIGITFDDSTLDARPYSLTGQNTPKAAYNRMTGLVTLGGPLQIPHLFNNGPNFLSVTNGLEITMPTRHRL